MLAHEFPLPQSVTRPESCGKIYRGHIHGSANHYDHTVNGHLATD